MQNSQLDRLLRFAQRTGDRLIITDAQGKQPVVILSLDEYEALLGAQEAPPKSRPAPAPQVAEEEEEVDLTKIEEAVAAANKDFTPKTKGKVDDGGEEQFYLEPV